jgi:hypothetical protein
MQVEFSADKIVRSIPTQAKYIRYYSLLAGRIAAEKNNSAAEQLFPQRIKLFELQGRSLDPGGFSRRF